MGKKFYDVIILGLGAMGSAAAYQLAAKKARVLGIDRYSPPHAMGSSHGDTRVTRQAIGEGAAYTPLALRSNEIWRDLERQTGQELYVAAGGLLICDPNDTAAIHGNTNFLQLTMDLAKQFSIPHDMLTADALRQRFPQFKVRGAEIGYYEYGAGYLRPERCIEVQLRLAEDLGADIHTNETVLEYDSVGDHVQVRTDRGVYEAARLIVSAGPWVTEFLSARLKNIFKVYRQVLYWFDVEKNYEAFASERCPVFIWKFGAADEDWIYGFPAVDGKSGGIKVATEEYLRATTPESVERLVRPEEAADMYARRVQPYLEGVGGKCLRAVSCLYTATPDSSFVLDFHPEMPQVIVASPCSGHGFKHSAAIGEVLADLALTGDSRMDISSFSFQRFSHTH